MILVFEIKTKGIQGNRAMVQPFSNMVNTINYTLVLMFEVQKKAYGILLWVNTTGTFTYFQIGMEQLGHSLVLYTYYPT